MEAQVSVQKTEKRTRTWGPELLTEQTPSDRKRLSIWLPLVFLDLRHQMHVYQNGQILSNDGIEIRRPREVLGIGRVRRLG